MRKTFQVIFLEKLQGKKVLYIFYVILELFPCHCLSAPPI
jgi:hypothetical protein